MSRSPGELILLIGALGSAAALLAGPASWRRPASLAALTLAVSLIAAENWETGRARDLRDDPALLAAGLAAAAAVTGLLALVFRGRPELLGVAAAAVVALRVPVGIGGGDVHLLLPLYVVIAAGLAARWGEIDLLEPTRHWRWALRALALVLVLYAAQSAYGPGFSQAAENAGFFFAPFAVLLILVATLPWSRRLAVLTLGVLIAEGLVFTAVAAGQYAAGELWWNQKVIEGNQYHEWFRVNSLFWDPNIFGRYLAVTIALAGAVIAHAPTSRAVWSALAASLVMLAGLGASFSQSALLALIAGLVVIVAMRWSVRRTAVALGACLAIALAAILISGAPDLSEERVEQETSGRVGLIRGGIELAEDQPFAGHGSGAFAPEYKRKFEANGDVAVSSHSEPITIAAEQGAVGLIAFAALLVTCAMALISGLVPRRNGESVRWVQVARIGVLAGFAVMVANSIAYAAFLTDPITWALLGAGLALSRREAESLTDV